MTTVTRHVLDVSEMPDGALDHRSPIWWGNLLLLSIETTMFAIAVAAYFYLQMNFPQWPPVQSNTSPPDFHPLPTLGLSIVNLVIILISCVPMVIADLAALKCDRRVVTYGFIACIALGLVAIGLRWFEFYSIRFRWDENAYGSIVWFIVGMHFTHLIAGTCENGIMLAWMLRHGLDEKHARDVRIGALYWYWIAAIWIVLWAIVFLSPHLF